MAWLDRLKDGLVKTQQGVKHSLRLIVDGEITEEALEEFEAELLQADVGVGVAGRLVSRLRTGGSAVRSYSIQVLKDVMMETLLNIQSDSLETLIRKGPKPFVILAIGVNGVGKTTSMAKLASRLKSRDLTPLLVAADTFRAAAIEQLDIWGSRIGVEVIKHRQGSDPSAVVFDGIAAGKARNVDVVLIDTAGRLHTKVNLMDELKKMKRVLEREMPGAPHEVLLTLDGTIGQNAFMQAKQFHEALGVTGLVLTKLDGTSKGGIVLAIADELHIPVRLVGVGEQVDDLQDFHAKEFLDVLLEE